jgi:hypothetical protein
MYVCMYVPFYYFLSESHSLTHSKITLQKILRQQQKGAAAPLLQQQTPPPPPCVIVSY